MFSMVFLPIFAILGLFASAFFFWKKGREEHYDEGVFFDVFLLSVICGYLAGRASFIALNFSQFSVFLVRWLDSVSYPGFNLTVAVCTSAIVVYYYAQKYKWDIFEVLDFWVLAASVGLSVYSIGLFFAGVGYGYPTSLPWGVIFPNLLEPHHPLQLYGVIFYLALAIYLSKVEYSYRTFEWYRYGKKTAQTGFLTAIFIIATAVFLSLMSFLRLPALVLFSISIDRVLALALCFVGGLFLYLRSGRPFPSFGGQARKPLRTTLDDLRGKK